jgi:hypothetical protein
MKRLTLLAIYTELVGMFGIEQNKEGYYNTTWGKKTETGLFASIDNILQPILKENEQYQDKLPRRNLLVDNLRKEIEGLKKKLNNITPRFNALYDWAIKKSTPKEINEICKI